MLNFKKSTIVNRAKAIEQIEKAIQAQGVAVIVSQLPDAHLLCLLLCAVCDGDGTIAAKYGVSRQKSWRIRRKKVK